MSNRHGTRLPTFDSTTAHAARVYDAMLGGKDNFQVDRDVFDKVVEAYPETPVLARQQRGFLREITAYSAGKLGIKQFLELGSGLPTAENVHDVAHRVDPAARVVYVDHDPIVRSHGQALLAGPETRMVVADLRRADALLSDPGIASFLDLADPIAVTVVGVLHFLGDEDGPLDVIAAYRDRLVAGSTVGLSAATSTGTEPDAMTAISAAYGTSSTPLVWRGQEAIAGFFDGLSLVTPGVVDVRNWPDPSDTPPGKVRIIGGLGVVNTSPEI